MKRIVMLVAGLLAVGLVFAGCSKSEEPAKTSASPARPESSIKVSEAWARSSATTANAGAVYMNIENDGSADDKLLSASVSPEVAAVAELHETVKVMTPTATSTSASGGGMGLIRLASQSAAESDHSKGEMSPSPGNHMGGDQSGMMKMQQVKSIAIPAGKTTKLEPGGYHVMLMSLAKPLTAGQTIAITLTFEKAGKKEVKATVKEA